MTNISLMNARSLITEKGVIYNLLSYPNLSKKNLLKNLGLCHI